jgi:hypothetical protein
MKLSIEVNFTSGDASKLERYQAIGVDEVWFWEDGVLAAYACWTGTFQQCDRSTIPALNVIDLDVLANCVLVGETSRIQAAQQLLEAHQAGS